MHFLQLISFNYLGGGMLLMAASRIHGLVEGAMIPDGAEHGWYLPWIVQTPAKKVLLLHDGLKWAWNSVLI